MPPGAGRLTQICALSWLLNELLQIKRRKGKHVILTSPPCCNLNPNLMERCCTAASFSIIAMTRADGGRRPSSTSTKNCLPLLKTWPPMTDHLVTWLPTYICSVECLRRNYPKQFHNRRTLWNWRQMWILNIHRELILLLTRQWRIFSMIVYV